MDLIIEDMMAKLQKSETFGGRLTEAREEVERWDGNGIGYNQGELADLLAEVAAGGPAMLATEDTAAANAWLRRRVRVYVRDNQVTEVRFAFW